MWGEAGKAYVYLIYGIHHCLNAVTVGGAGEAVLIRGGVVIAGEDSVSRRRGASAAFADLVGGPGKLCRGLEIDRSFDGADLCRDDGPLWIGGDGFSREGWRIERTARIGVESAGEAARLPLRMVLKTSV